MRRLSKWVRDEKDDREAVASSELYIGIMRDVDVIARCASIEAPRIEALRASIKENLYRLSCEQFDGGYARGRQAPCGMH